MPMLEVDGASLRYEAAILPGRPCVLFSNSLGASLRMWDGVVAALGDAYSVVRYDTRGLGASSTPAGPYTLDQLGHDALALLDHLGVERAAICGLSMGGLVAQWLGVHAPGRVDGLVLANTAAKIGSDATWNARIAAVRADGMEPLAAATMERWFTAEFRQQRPNLVSAVRTEFAACDVEGYIANCAAIRDADLRADLAAIDVPVLAVFGTQDPVTTEADARALAAAIPGGRVAGLEAAHLSATEQPETFARLLRNFLLKDAGAA